MKNYGIVLGILWIVILMIIISTGLGTYNRLVDLDTACETAQANVETMLQRRVEVIPDLVASVKYNAEHIEKVYAAANAVEAANRGLKEALENPSATDEEIVAADSKFNASVEQLAVYVQQVPELNDSQQMTKLMDEIAGSVSRITNARYDYNEAVAKYNKAIRRFPGVIFASIMGYEKRTPYQATEEAHQTNVVNFD